MSAAPPLPGRQVATRRAERACRLIEWKPWPHDSALIGHCSIAFAGGWVINRIPVFRKADGSLSAGTPDVPDLDRDGRIRLKPDGKKSYGKIVTFETAEGRERWQRLILQALAEAGVGNTATINTEPGETR